MCVERVLTVANVRGLSRAGNIQSKGIIPGLDKDRGTVAGKWSEWRGYLLEEGR